jgi:hypothetical protein
MKKRSTSWLTGITVRRLRTRAKPCGSRNERERGGWQQPNAGRDCRNRRNKGYMREHIKLLEQTAKLFAEGEKHPAANKTAAELSLWTKALAQLTGATYTAKRPTISYL